MGWAGGAAGGSMGTWSLSCSRSPSAFFCPNKTICGGRGGTWGQPSPPERRCFF